MKILTTIGKYFTQNPKPNPKIGGEASVLKINKNVNHISDLIEFIKGLEKTKDDMSIYGAEVNNVDRDFIYNNLLNSQEYPGSSGYADRILFLQRKYETESEFKEKIDSLFEILTLKMATFSPLLDNSDISYSQQLRLLKVKGNYIYTKKLITTENNAICSVNNTIYLVSSSGSPISISKYNKTWNIGTTPEGFLGTCLEIDDSVLFLNPDGQPVSFLGFGVQLPIKDTLIQGDKIIIQKKTPNGNKPTKYGYEINKVYIYQHSTGQFIEEKAQHSSYESVQATEEISEYSTGAIYVDKKNEDNIYVYAKFGGKNICLYSKPKQQSKEEKEINPAEYAVGKTKSDTIVVKKTKQRTDVANNYDQTTFYSPNGTIKATYNGTLLDNTSGLPTIFSEIASNLNNFVFIDKSGAKNTMSIVSPSGDLLFEKKSTASGFGYGKPNNNDMNKFFIYEYNSNNILTTTDIFVTESGKIEEKIQNTSCERIGNFLLTTEVDYDRNIVTQYKLSGNEISYAGITKGNDFKIEERGPGGLYLEYKSPNKKSGVERKEVSPSGGYRVY